MSLWCQVFKQIKHVLSPKNIGRRLLWISSSLHSALLYSVLCRPILWLYHLERTPVYHNLLHMALCVRERTHDGKTAHTSLSAISCQGDQKPWCWSPKQTKESLKWKDWLIRSKQKVMVWIKRSHRVWAFYITGKISFGCHRSDCCHGKHGRPSQRARFCGEIQWCMKWQV